jgi:hypothetical protein
VNAKLDSRLRRLEAAGDGAAQPTGILVLPTGMAMSDAAVDRLVAEHVERTAWRGAVVVLPDNGRDAVP